MKIEQSNVQLSSVQRSDQSQAALTSTTVEVVENGSGNGNTSAAQITLSQRYLRHEAQALTSVANVRDADGGDTDIESHYLAQSLTSGVIDQNVVVRAVRGIPAEGSSAVASTEVLVTSVLQLEQSEALSFEAVGQVTTADGRSIDFMLALDMQRNTEIEQSNLFQGNINLIDPLMINLNGGVVELSDQTFEFDLNADGHKDQVAMAASGTGYLVFDRNGNGQIDDGSEMFGPQSGQGFAELSQLDDDGNGWLDENDSLYASLAVMTFAEDGSAQQQSLSEAGVGALWLNSVAADYDLYAADGSYQGKIRQNGVALAESGQSLLLQEVHLRNFVPQAQQIVTQLQQGPALVTDSSGEAVQAQPLMVESPLNFFQFDDALLNQREEETRVGLGFVPNLNGLETIRIRRQQPESSMMASAQWSQLNVTAQWQTAQTSDRVSDSSRLEMRSWVAHSMEGFSISNDSVTGYQGVSVSVSYAAVQVANVLSDYASEQGMVQSEEQQQYDRLKTMVEALRNSRERWQSSQNALLDYRWIQASA